MLRVWQLWVQEIAEKESALISRGLDVNYDGWPENRWFIVCTQQIELKDPALIQSKPDPCFEENWRSWLNYPLVMLTTAETHYMITGAGNRHAMSAPLCVAAGLGVSFHGRRRPLRTWVYLRGGKYPETWTLSEIAKDKINIIGLIRGLAWKAKSWVKKRAQWSPITFVCCRNFQIRWLKDKKIDMSYARALIRWWSRFNCFI